MNEYEYENEYEYNEKQGFCGGGEGNNNTRDGNNNTTATTYDWAFWCMGVSLLLLLLRKSRKMFTFLLKAEVDE